MRNLINGLRTWGKNWISAWVEALDDYVDVTYFDGEED